METGYLNHYVITLNSNAIRDAQLYCGTSSEPWNDEDGWDDIKHVTPYLGIRRFRDAADMEEARKDIAEEYGCAPEKVSRCQRRRSRPECLAPRGKQGLALYGR